MSGDHNMNQSDPGWRKRQIALDKKAENARELGLDYNKTIIEMAREAGFKQENSAAIQAAETFAAMVREDERERIAQMFDDAFPIVSFAMNDQGGCLMCGFTPKLAAAAIRSNA